MEFTFAFKLCLFSVHVTQKYVCTASVSFFLLFELIKFQLITQVVGSAVLCVGIWLAVDKTSFINLAKFSTLNEGVQVC